MGMGQFLSEFFGYVVSQQRWIHIGHRGENYSWLLLAISFADYRFFIYEELDKIIIPLECLVFQKFSHLADILALSNIFWKKNIFNFQYQDYKKMQENHSVNFKLN